MRHVELPKCDALFVLGNEIERVGDSYVPATHGNVDDKGYLVAADFRVDGAAAAYLLGMATTIYFCGRPKKPINDEPKYPWKVPSEASLGSTAFRRRLRNEPDYPIAVEKFGPPKIILNEISKMTRTDVTVISDIIQQRGYTSPLVMTNLFHMDRFGDFLGDYLDDKPELVRPDVVPAEYFAGRVFGVQQKTKHLDTYMATPHTNVWHAYHARVAVEHADRMNSRRRMARLGR